MNNLNREFNIREGTISFWIKENKVVYNDDTLYSFVDISNEEGAVFILKDFDRKIKFFHIYINKGRTDVEWDCSSLENNKKHMITATWSSTNGEIKLYVDGKLVGKSKMKN